MSFATWPEVPRGEAVHRLFQAGIDPPRQGLSALVNTSVAIRERWRFLPAAASPAMAERVEEGSFAAPGPWGTDPVTAAHNAAWLLLAAAEDHIKALCKVLDGPDTPTYSHMVIGRAALEASARALWLGEPGTGTRRRVARLMTERLHSLDQQARLPTAPEHAARAKARHAELLREAERQGFRKLHSKRDGTTIEERREGNTRAIEWLLGRGAQTAEERTALGEVVYRYFSAVAHGTLYGLGASMQRDRRVPADGDVVLGMLYVSSDGVRLVLGAVALGYAEALEGLTSLFGWQDDDYVTARAAALQATR